MKGKVSLEIKEWEHAEVEKAGQLFRDVLRGSICPYPEFSPGDGRSFFFAYPPIYRLSLEQGAKVPDPHSAHGGKLVKTSAAIFRIKATR